VPRDTVLLTNGRLPKAMDIARALHRAGCRVGIADPFRMHLSKVSNCVDFGVRVPAPRASKSAYLDALRAAVARERAALLMPVSEETAHVSALHAALGEETRVFTMPQAEVLAVHDKLSFVEVARAAGVHVPAAALLGSDDARAIAAVGEYVIKPRLSCAGRGVGLFPRGAPLPEPDPAAPAIVQARVRGEECSTFAVAHQGRVIGNVSYRGVLRSGTVAVCFEQVRDLPAVDEWVGRFVAARNWSGFIAFDFIVDAAGLPWGIECNPRANSGIHFVEEDSLAQAILQPASTDRLRFRPPGWRQQFYSCLTEAQSRMWRRGFGAYYRVLREAKDVTWDRRDPLPFWLMTFTAANLLWASARTGRPIGEIATDDISWYEDGPSP
jgi:hypothetical protein